MKIVRLQATDVHGYLPINIEFFDDLTFLTGLNGSGKTSALRILMGLLTPNFEELSQVSFTSASVTFCDSKRDNVVIKAQRARDGLVLSISDLPKTPLHISSAEIEILVNLQKKDEERRSPILDRVSANPTMQAIASLSTPMFLGLDRRFTISAFPWEDTPFNREWRRREFTLRRTRGVETPELLVSPGLWEVNILVANTMHTILAAQEQLDEKLRTKILLSAFKFEPANAQFGTPNWNEMQEFRNRQIDIENAAKRLNVPLDEVKSALETFFERMNHLVGVFQGPDRPDQNKEIAEWIMNKPQLDRILDHIRLLDEYGRQRSALHEPITRFLALVNGFLVHTRKKVEVSDRGELIVRLSEHSEPRPISALSSGERQIVVMLGHLSFNRNLSGSGVFIVDEPELSLHIGWQEQFVEAIQRANPRVQLIMATHSPAIILDRDDNCCSLDDVNGKDDND